MAQLSEYDDIISSTARLITPPGEKPKFSDVDVWQFVKLAILRVQQMMRSRGMKEMTASVDSAVVAGTAYINGATIGAYGLITKPLRLWERPTSDANGWVQMRYQHPLPLNQDAGEYFRCWDFMRLDRGVWQIMFPAACTRAMTVRIYGDCEILIVNSTTHQAYNLNNTTAPVSFFAASLAAQSFNKGLAETLERQAMEFMDGLAAEDIHQRQLQPARMYAVRSGLRDRWW